MIIYFSKRDGISQKTLHKICRAIVRHSRVILDTNESIFVFWARIGDNLTYFSETGGYYVTGYMQFSSGRWCSRFLRLIYFRLHLVGEGKSTFRQRGQGIRGILFKQYQTLQHIESVFPGYVCVWVISSSVAVPSFQSLLFSLPVFV